MMTSRARTIAVLTVLALAAILTSCAPEPPSAAQTPSPTASPTIRPTPPTQIAELEDAVAAALRGESFDVDEDSARAFQQVVGADGDGWVAEGFPGGVEVTRTRVTATSSRTHGADLTFTTIPFTAPADAELCEIPWTGPVSDSAECEVTKLDDHREVIVEQGDIREVYLIGDVFIVSGSTESASLSLTEQESATLDVLKALVAAR
ncbi:MAG: hypothetical protein QM607_07225 [Microbacterium sp.]